MTPDKKAINNNNNFKFTLGRMVDVNYPTNRWLLIAMLLIASIASLISASVMEGIYTAMGFFFAWALTREIDPIKEYSAFISGFFALSIIFFYDGVNLAPMFFLLISTRFVSGVCGYKATYLDIFSLLLFAGFLSYSWGSSIFLLMLVLMFFLASPKIPFPSTVLSTTYKADKIKDDQGGIVQGQTMARALTYYLVALIMLLNFAEITQSTKIILLTTILGGLLGRILGVKER